MKNEKSVILFVLLSLIISVSIGAATVFAQHAEVPYGAYPDELIFFYQGGESTVIPKIETGEMQAYLWWLNVANTKLAEQSDKIDLVNAYGLYNELVVNPLVTTGSFNPFSIREVREALNWLIDREYIVNELWFGKGVAKTTLFKAIGPDYARAAGEMKQLENKYEYDFQIAKTQIFTALADAGATIVGGKWNYNGTAITVKLLIRSEDERRPTGDYLASQLELCGFTVERNYKPSSEAYLLWGQLSTTKSGAWHIYTAGWISTAMVAYEDDLAWFMYSEDNMPLYSEYEPSPLLSVAMDKLNNGEYANIEERNDLVVTITNLCLEDGCHIMYMDQLVSFPYSTDLGPFVYDLYGGDQSLFSLRSLRYDSGAGGTIKLGLRNIFIEGFNPVCGFSWLYDVPNQWLVEDVGTYPHPHTGSYIPVRTAFDVETAGPTGTPLSVPSDALQYNLTAQAFQEVGADIEATSKVTFNLTLGKWHHGENINRADILYNIAELFKVTTPGNDLYDAIAVTAKRSVFTSKLKGIKFLDDDTIDVYIDYWHPDETYIAYYSDLVWPSTPWEMISVGNDVVSNKELAWSIDNADIWGVDMLDQTKGASLPILAASLTDLKTANYIPPEIADLVSTSEAETRWAAYATWYADMGHFYVSNGPYYFDHVDTDALQISLKPFREYVFKANVWDNMLTVKIPEVTATTIPTTVVPGLNSTFKFAVTVNGTPYAHANMTYLLMDSTGQLTGSGDVTNKGAGVFQADLNGTTTSKMVAGSYKLLTITVGQEAAIPVFKEVVFTTTSEAAYIQSIVAQNQANIHALEESQHTLQSSLNTAINDLRNMQYIALGLAVVGILIAIVAFVKKR
ncbi:ABC transporter substrate-binding protein [Candidatus Bathyarchaeota archaeon]|nr:ABC transporter substrate-binding protein [Candidatus Bathyarchaeota archaeon]